MAFLQPSDARLLRSSWTVRSTAGEPVAAVHVRNLQTVVKGPADAWGRAGKPQPLLVSAEVHFSKQFDIAAAQDRVDLGGTVHYGTLSKTLLGGVETYNDMVTGKSDNHESKSSTTTTLSTLRSLLDHLWLNLTGGTLAREEVVLGQGFLDLSSVRFLSLTVCLPKASLLGDGISLTTSAVFQTTTDTLASIVAYSHTLSVDRVRVPTLIGVNDNERLAKQIVAISVEIDRYRELHDHYTTLELLVVKFLSESSFETLEALGSHLAQRIITDWGRSSELTHGSQHFQINLRMEKPTAVPFAECPVVEMRVGGM